MVQLWSNKNIFDIIDQLIVLYGTHKSTELLSTVYIILDNFDETINYLELQKQAKNVAKELRPFKFLFYFILLQMVRYIYFYLLCTIFIQANLDLFLKKMVIWFIVYIEHAPSGKILMVLV